MVGSPSPNFRSWASGRKPQIDVPKLPKYVVGYVMPPHGTTIECSTCVHFLSPSECEIVGNSGAVIHPQGCCDKWDAEGTAHASPDDPNVGIDTDEEEAEEYDDPSSEDEGDTEIDEEEPGDERDMW